MTIFYMQLSVLVCVCVKVGGRKIENIIIRKKKQKDSLIQTTLSTKYFSVCVCERERKRERERSEFQKRERVESK